MIMATMRNKDPSNQMWHQVFRHRLHFRCERLTLLVATAATLFIVTMNVLNNYFYFDNKIFPSLSAQDSIQEHRRVLAIQQEVQAQLLATAFTEENSSSLVWPHLMYSDYKYRRVCADVYQSTLCMTIRFPFPVPVQLESVPFPFPVEPRFYQLNEPTLFIDGPYLEACHRLNYNNSKDIPINHRVLFCLENVALHHPNQALVVFTRRRHHSKDENYDEESGHEDFFGTKSEHQQKHLYEFFDDHDLVVLGDSLGPFVVSALYELFDNANDSDDNFDRPHLCSPLKHSILGTRHVVYQHTCRQNQSDRISAAETIVTESENFVTAPETVTRGVLSEQKPHTEILLTNFWFMPGVYYSEYHGHLWHIVNDTKPLIDEIRSNIKLLRPRGMQQQQPSPEETEQSSNDKDTSNKLRKISILVEFPFAHVQNQHMVYDSYAHIEHNHERMTQLIMNVTTPATKLDWAELGFELDHLIVFDGFPQHFPTFTSGYVHTTHLTENDFLKASGYPGWYPEMGSTCRGPLPPTSALTRLNQLERLHFEHEGFDMKRWYGKTWEFTNQFWWELVMWSPLGTLDCTHPKAHLSAAAAPRVLKYFLQAMVDDYFSEEKQR